MSLLLIVFTFVNIYDRIGIKVNIIKRESITKFSKRSIDMPYTVEEGGRLNNYAKEPKMYVAREATQTEKRNYIIVAALGVALIGGLIALAAIVS
ncbi:MAG: photosystem II assembly protein Psb34 [Prochloraceae cyanobacterium]